MSTLTRETPTTADPWAPLRMILRIDGWSTAAFGVLLLAAARPFDDLLGLPTAWSVPFGVAMLGGALALLLIAGHPEISRGRAMAVVAGNSLSCAALLALVLSGVLPLNAWGVAFLLSGAVVVAVYAALELTGFRRCRAASASAPS